MMLVKIQITSAMGVAHDSMIIHRDLKPQNILIMDDGGIKITDFGIAMALNATQLTQTNSAMGSVHYFPPEQANGKGSTLKSDVYSLGIMMYELLTGNLPFRGDNAVEIALKHLKEPIPDIKQEIPNLPQSIENIIVTATAKNQKNRYANANEMHEDLLTCLNKERLNEPKKILKYSEGISDELAITDNGNNVDNSIISQIKDDGDEKNKKILIFGGILIALISILAVVFFVMPLLTEVKDAKVPNLENKSISEAEETLEKLKFYAEIKKESSSEIEEGKVIRTEPSAGATRKEGATIIVVVSSGEVSYIVEDLTGKNYIEVKTRLEELYKIKVSVEEKEVEASKTKEYDEQEIIGQSVDPDSKLVAGDEITIYIPKVLEKYPDIVAAGWTVSKTQTWAKEKGIVLEISYQETSTYAEGTIMGQSRGTDSIIVSGATLKITVAKKPVVQEEPKNEESETPTEGETNE